MANRFIHEDDAKQLAIQASIACRLAAMDRTSEYAAELLDTQRAMTAMVIAAGGRIEVGDRELVMAKDAKIETYRDERNRRLVLRVSGINLEEREGVN